jgi:hypothetical protein
VGFGPVKGDSPWAEGVKMVEDCLEGSLAGCFQSEGTGLLITSVMDLQSE